MPESIAIAGVILRNTEEQYLLVQEGLGKVAGLWNLPAGHVDPGETPMQGAVREAKEEVGLDVELEEGEAFYTEEVPEDNRVFHIFRGKIVGGEIKILDGEIPDAEWYTFEQIQQLKLEGKIRSPRVTNSIEKAEAYANSRD